MEVPGPNLSAGLSLQTSNHYRYSLCAIENSRPVLLYPQKGTSGRTVYSDKFELRV